MIVHAYWYFAYMIPDGLLKLTCLCLTIMTVILRPAHEYVVNGTRARLYILYNNILYTRINAVLSNATLSLRLCIFCRYIVRNKINENDNIQRDVDAFHIRFVYFLFFFFYRIYISRPRHEVVL